MIITTYITYGYMSVTAMFPVGLEADQGIDNQEISYIVDGNLPDRHQVLVISQL
jgi:hypothetical protein